MTAHPVSSQIGWCTLPMLCNPLQFVCKNRIKKLCVSWSHRPVYSVGCWQTPTRKKTITELLNSSLPTYMYLPDVLTYQQSNSTSKHMNNMPLNCFNHWKSLLLSLILPHETNQVGTTCTRKITNNVGLICSYLDLFVLAQFRPGGG